MEGIYNMPLRHVAYGEGFLREWTGNLLTVRFARGDVKFWFPMAFEDVLSATNEQDGEKIRQLTQAWVISHPPECVRYPERQRGRYAEIYAEAKAEQERLAKEEETKSLLRLAGELSKRSEAAPASADPPAAPVSAETKEGAKRKTLADHARIRLNLGSASFVIGMILAVASLCGLIMLIIIECGAASWGVDSDTVTTVMIIGLALFLLGGFLGHAVSLFLRTEEKTTPTLVLYILTVVQYAALIFIVVWFIYLISTMIWLLREGFSSGGSSGGSGEKVWKIYVGGTTYQIKRTSGVQYDAHGDRYAIYRDQFGNNWYSRNEKDFISESDFKRL